MPTFRECVESGINPDGSPMDPRHREVYQYHLDYSSPRPPVHVGNCIYRGEETRRVKCDTCRPGYKVRVAVFHCNCPRVVQQEATILIPVKDLATCKDCDHGVAAEEVTRRMVPV